MYLNKQLFCFFFTNEYEDITQHKMLRMLQEINSCTKRLIYIEAY